MYLSDQQKLANFSKATFSTNITNSYTVFHFEYFLTFCLCLFCRRVSVNYYSKWEVKALRKHFPDTFSPEFISKQ